MREGSVLVGKYRVERVLGQGGMGIVVAARHEQLDDYVAIKLMLPEVAASPDAVARFVREARAAAKIKSEHIARVSDVGTLETGEPYMVMEYLEGADLSATLQQQGRLPLDQAADYLLQACEAIAQAHELGIVHRDLKPANLYVVTNRRDGLPLVKVLDFGISKMAQTAVDSSMTKTSALMGSPLYMSPEQMQSARDVDLRTDIWALGVILFELLSGQPPFDGDTLPQVCAQILQGPTPDIRRFLPELPDAVVRVIERCLERDPARRFASVDDLASELAPFSRWGTWKRASRRASPGDRSTPAVPAGSAPAGVATSSAWGETSPELPVQRFPWVLAAAAVVVLLGGVGSALALRSRPTAPPPDLGSAAAPNVTSALALPPTSAPGPSVAPATPPAVASAPLAQAAPSVTPVKSPAVAAAGKGARPASARPAVKTPPPEAGSKPAVGTGSLGGRL